MNKKMLKKLQEWRGIEPEPESMLSQSFATEPNRPDNREQG